MLITPWCLYLTFYYLVDNTTSLKLLIPKHLSRHLFTVKWQLSSTFIQLVDALHDLYLSYLTCSALLAFTLRAPPFSFCSCTSFLPPSFSVLPLHSPTYLCHFNYCWNNSHQHSSTLFIRKSSFQLHINLPKTYQLKFFTLGCLAKEIFFPLKMATYWAELLPRMKPVNIMLFVQVIKKYTTCSLRSSSVVLLNRGF